MNIFNGHSTYDGQPLNMNLLGGDKPIGRYFTLSEFACADGEPWVMVFPPTLAGLDLIRFHLGQPVFINSGFRTPSWNARIGGASQSLHMHGMAADIWAWNVSPSEIAQLAERLGFGGIKAYSTFTHIDTGKIRSW